MNVKMDILVTACHVKVCAHNNRTKKNEHVRSLERKIPFVQFIGKNGLDEKIYRRIY